MLSTCAGWRRKSSRISYSRRVVGTTSPPTITWRAALSMLRLPGLEHLDQRRHAPPAQRSHAGEHLLEVEGLGEVVVGAGVEPGEPVLDVVAGGEHQDRGRRLLEAEMAAEAHPVQVAAEHHVEDRDVVGEPRTQGFEGLLAAQGDVDRYAGFRQASGEASGDLRFVLDDEYAHDRHRRQRGSPRTRFASDSILARMNDVIAADGDLVDPAGSR